MTHSGGLAFARRCTAAAFAIVTCMLASGALASNAAASGHCASKWDTCAWANADWSGSYLLVEPVYGGYIRDYTKLGTSSWPGCTQVEFNDCASSIDNNGPYTGYYYWNVFCGGQVYTNSAYTGTNFIGSFWNDEFSSGSEGLSYSSC